MILQRALPTDLQLAIENQRDFHTVYGTFRHKKTKDIRIPIFVRSNSIRSLSYTDEPDRILTGLYCTHGISPLIAPNIPDIDGVPVWIPSLNRYGCWSESLLELYLYPEETTWGNIEKDLMRYTCSATSKDNFLTNVLTIKNLSKVIDFIPDNLTMLLHATLDLRTREQREAQLTGLTERIESILNRYPFSPELLDVYPVLCEMYQKMAQLNNSILKSPVKKEEAMKIIKWYEKCVPIIHQYIKFDLQLPSNITAAMFLLSLWHADMGNYHTAMKYIKIYRKYNSDAFGAYLEVKALIAKKKKGSLH